MATDATGTPTSPDSIPTYNTAVDSPSGNGFNAAMAQIQTALSARVNSPASIASGEVPVWNGSAWVRSSVTGLNISGLAGFPNDATKHLGGDGVWQKQGIKLLYDTTDAAVSFPAASVTTSSLDQTFENLFILWRARSNASALSTNILTLPNSDTGADYNMETVRGTGTAAPTSAENLNSTLGMYSGDIPAATAEANTPGTGFLFIQGYANTNIRKPIIGMFTNAAQASSGTTGFEQVGMVGGRWALTGAITTLKFVPSSGSFNNANDTRISVYGIPG